MFIQSSPQFTNGKSTWQTFTSIFILLLLAFSLSGCQTITKFKCNTKNWNKVGQKDGAAGKLAGRTFAQYDDECSASGADIDKSIYLAGYQEGLATFCTMENGIAQAEEGYENNNLCATSFGSAFDDGFTQGLEKLCDSSGGQRFGVSGGIYRGTCPTDTEQEFLTSYLNGINASLPQSIANVTILEANSNRLQSDIQNLELQMSQYDNAIESAEKSNNKAWEERLEDDRSEISRRLQMLRMDKSRADRDLSKARVKKQSMQEMLLKWKSRLDV